MGTPSGPDQNEKFLVLTLKKFQSLRNLKCQIHAEVSEIPEFLPKNTQYLRTFGKNS